MTENTKKELENKIIETLYNCGDLNWHAWHWWKLKDSWFEQFDPNYIDEVAQELVKKGILETNGKGVRRKEKTLKEKIMCKIWG